VTLAGYSFGAMVALQVGGDEPGIDRLIAVAPPLGFFDLGFLQACRKPKLLVTGDRDPYCPVETFRRSASSLSDPTACAIVAGADHFFAGHEREVAEAVASFVCDPGPRA
jgi:alpha/beta superfamily hydrolase